MTTITSKSSSSSSSRKRPRSAASRQEGATLISAGSTFAKDPPTATGEVGTATPISLDESSPSATDNNTTIDTATKHPDRLTPHTLRLLKLIQEGTTEHAQRAIVLLARQCATTTASSSSIVLWNVLGRLQALPEWSTRTHASWAMQQVARYLPVTDQIQFLLQKRQQYPPTTTAAATAAAAAAAANTGVTSSDGDKSGSNGDQKISSRQDSQVTDQQKGHHQQQQQQGLWFTVFDLMDPKNNSNNEEDESPSLATSHLAQRHQHGTQDISSTVCLGLNQILQQGRPLLASTGTQYDPDYRREEAWLQTMDSQTSGNDDNISTATINHEQRRQQRMQFQRHVLAQRLGLAGLVQVVQRRRRKATTDGNNPSSANDNDDDMLPCLTADDDYYSYNEQTKKSDLAVSSTTITAGDHVNKQGMGNRANDDDDDKLPNAPFRALLLLEIKHQQYSSLSSTTTTTSHWNPQQLLATELVYRMFDPQWEVRHGAVLGILALLQAWHKTAAVTTRASVVVAGGGDSDGDDDQHDHHRRSSQPCLFGQWPHDILTKSIGLLALDRFGDYSATAVNVGSNQMESSSTRHHGKKSNNSNSNHMNNTTSGSRSVVAPVREVAGQLVAMLWDMAPRPIQQTTISLLLHLSQYSMEWEVRHAGLVAFKYLAVILLLKNDGATTSTKASIHHVDEDFYSQCLQTITETAIQRLSDSMEDVQSVAAQILMQLLVQHETRHSSTTTTTTQELAVVESTLIRAISMPLWSALQQPIHSISSCIVDLVQLFSWMLARDCSTVLEALQADHTNNTGEQKVTGKTLWNILSKWMEFLIQLDIPSVQVAALEAIGSIAEPVASFLSHATSNSSDPGALVEIYCRLLERIFESYFDPRLVARMERRSEEDVEVELETLVRTRDRTWARLVQAGASVFDQSREKLWSDCCHSLVFRYFDIRKCKQTTEDSWRFVNSTVTSPVRINAAPFQQMVDSANALAAFIQTVLGNERNSLVNRFEFALTSCLASPWTSKCEAACLLYSALLRSNQSKHKSLVLPNFYNELINLLSNTPLCLIATLRDPANEVLGNVYVVQSCNDTFLAMWEKIGQQPSDPLPSAATMKDFWKEVLKIRGLNLGDEDPTIPVSSVSMHLGTTIAGAVVAGGQHSLPTKLTPVVRPLMTSIKNEAKSPRLDETCRYLNELVQLLTQNGWDTSPVDSSSLRTAEKIVNNLCELACEDSDDGADACFGASRVLALLTESLPGNNTLESIKPIWADSLHFAITGMENVWNQILAMLYGS